MHSVRPIRNSADTRHAPTLDPEAATQPHRRETDYLIVGAGAMGMAFADEILSGRPEARITLVDRRAKPGGHWNDAYPFVALHQPAAFYGVNSASLGDGGNDLSSRAEILAYYERAMKRFLASGRVNFLPMSDYRGEGRVTSLVNEKDAFDFEVQRRVVDATYMNVQVPATHGPRYEVDPDITLVPPNDLVRLRRAWRRYNVIGGGKTGIDAVLFLLDIGVQPDRIRWIVPHDAWLWNRAVIQPGIAMAELWRQLQAVIDADSVDDVFLQLERQGGMFRLDTGRRPEKWRCATVNEQELAALRRVTDVIRMGRVERITTGQVQLEKGSLSCGEDDLFVDCTADGLARRPPRPFFEPGRITLQSVFMCQQVFSAALLGRLELLKCSDDERNGVCQVVPHPEYKQDLPTRLTASLGNVVNANRYIPFWLRRARLNVMSHEPMHRYLITALRAERALHRAQTSIARICAPA